MSLEDKLAELSKLGQEMGLPEIRACVVHEKINVCRKGNREGGCVWSDDPEDIKRIYLKQVMQ